MVKSVPDWKNNMDARQMEEAGLNLPPPHTINARVAPVDMHKQYMVKRKSEVGRSGAETQNMECPSKKAKTSPSQERRMVVAPRVTPDFVKRENMGLALKEEEEEEDPEEEEEDPEEETEEERRLREAVEEVKPSFPPNSQGSRPVGLSSSQVLNRLEEIVWAVQRSEELERHVNESRQKIDVLEREKADLASLVSKLRRSQRQLEEDIRKKHKEFGSLKWRMEQDRKELIEIRSKLERAAHKAKELTEIITTQDRTQKIK